ncbi:hypothetical protein REPUB_Repub15cG0025000 [Reevesia pubescens]
MSLFKIPSFVKNKLDLIQIRARLGYSKFGLWKSIALTVGRHGSDTVLFYGLGFSLGSGDLINFWTDNFTDGGALKCNFLRIFALGTTKTEKVKDFRRWINGKWEWVISLRMSKSYCKAVSLNSYEKKALWNLVWAGVTPPKVEALCWLVVKEKVAVKEFFAAKSVINWNNSLCVFFKSSFLVEWLGLFPSKDLCHLIWTIKFRLASWCKAKWPNLQTSFEDVFRCHNLVSLPSLVSRRIVASSWVAPPPGFVKFYVDGSAYGKPGRAEIRGVLSDESSNVLLVFSKSVGLLIVTLSSFWLSRKRSNFLLLQNGTL